jgi:hypothetical protein
LPSRFSTKVLNAFLVFPMPTTCLSHLTPWFDHPHNRIRGCIQKFPDWVITKYTLTIINTRWEAIQRVMAAKLTRLTHNIAIHLYLVAESCTICSSRSRQPVRKLLDTPSCITSHVTLFHTSCRLYITLHYIICCISHMIWNESKSKICLCFIITKHHALFDLGTRWRWVVSFTPRPLYPRERTPVTHWIGGWASPRTVLDAVVKRKIPSSRRESNPRTPIVQPVAQRYTDWASTDLCVCVYIYI